MTEAGYPRMRTTGMAPLVAVALLSVLSVALGVRPAAGQFLGLGEGAGDEPIEVEASESLEWLQDEQLYVARGDAVLIQGEDRIEADVITARYEEGEGGEQQIVRVTLEGGVRIVSGDNEVLGGRGVYDMAAGTFILTGDNLQLSTPTETVTARDSLEYFEAENLAVARGAARVIAGTDRLDGDVIAARFGGGEDGGGAGGGPADRGLRQVTATGNVVLVTETDTVIGDEVTYDAVAEVAVVRGNVRIGQGDSVLNGDVAEIDLASGISRLRTEGGRVRALLTQPPGAE